MIPDDLQSKLDSIKFDYETERAHRSAQAMSLAETPADQCRYCGKRRVAFPSSVLDGHSICVTGVEFRQRLAEAMQDPRMSYRLVAETIGVHYPTVRKWYLAGNKDRK